MTEDEYLAALLKRNPALDKPDDETITLRVRGLKAIVRQAFQKGKEAGKPDPYPQQDYPKDNSAGAVLFEKLFGGRIK